MSTQIQESKVAAGPLRGYRRSKAVRLPDLNVPPTETRDETGASDQRVQSRGQEQPVPVPIPPATIDLEAIDDDVIESSPRAFAEAKNNAQRTRQRTVIDLDSDLATRVRLTHGNRHKRRREQCIILDCSSSTTGESVQSSLPPSQPTFSCPICMGPFVEETSTRCGHIFCKQCIKTAMSVQSKCPSCRKKITSRELIRVFLPAAR